MGIYVDIGPLCTMAVATSVFVSTGDLFLYVEGAQQIAFLILWTLVAALSLPFKFYSHHA